MMTNLFSMFDPSNFIFKMAWVIPMLSIFMPSLISHSKFNIIYKKMVNSLKIEFFSITSSSSSNIILLPLFLLIMTINMISLIPSSFTLTAQMSAIFPLTLTLWLTSTAYFLIKKTNKFLSHLVPTGSPTPLMPAMVLIELVSNLIRPITLSVRLVANITAGHLLMHLLSSFSCSSAPLASMVIMFPTALILNTLELGVAIIQSYILCTLIALYSSEIH